MLFNSFIFLYFFLPITYGIFWSLKTKEHRYLWLTAASYVFYGYWNWKFCFWMAFSTIVSFLAGCGMLYWNTPSRRRLCLIVPILIDLSVLGFFKYANFFIQSVAWLLNHAGHPTHAPLFDILLPIGISFYTFHTISYIVDSYRRTITPTKNFWEFACYVSLFSQLVAGPIVRFRQIEGDLENIDHASRRSFLDKGWSFFTIGLVKKVLIADTIATVINPAMAHALQLSSLSAWLCTLGYTYQLYFDFSGYSDMAVGLGYLFGLRLPQNFNSPYKADSLGDFWHRWHMSLSSCLRDYLYIPLGGNRGPAWFVARNIFITMLIGGLWHGANWTFVFWGAYHGTLLILLRFGHRLWDRWPKALRQGVTFMLVFIGWIFFGSPTFTIASSLLHKLVSFQSGLPVIGAGTLAFMLLIAGLIAHRAPNTFEMSHHWSPRFVFSWSLLFVICLWVMYGAQSSPFLYFQF
jgi:alginate O-acetyltransferase complex protein AlgI